MNGDFKFADFEVLRINEYYTKEYIHSIIAKEDYYDKKYLNLYTQFITTFTNIFTRHFHRYDWN